MGKYATFLRLAEVLYMHERLLKRYGGANGIRDLGLIESALARPQSGYYETLSSQAASLLQSLATNHAFVDGNKRVAFASCAVFLRLNGYCLVVSADDAESFIISEIIASHASLETITAWLEKHMLPV